jgi:hypothetical protein
MSEIVKYESRENEMKYFRDICKTCMASGKYGAEMNEATMLNIMLTAKDLGISPLKAINGGFYIVNGKISMSTTIMADRIRSAGHSIKILDNTSKSCTLFGTRKDNGDTCKIEYTMEDAQIAGLTNSPTWKKHPKAMLYNRAMSMLARMLFPDVVGNAYSEDEGHEIQGLPPSKRPDIDPDETTMETINVETGEVVPTHTIQDLHAACNVGTIEHVEEFVRFIAIAKKDKGWDESKVICSMMENDKALEDFKEKLTKRIEKKYTMEVKTEEKVQSS